MSSLAKAPGMVLLCPAIFSNVIATSPNMAMLAAALLRNVISTVFCGILFRERVSGGEAEATENPDQPDDDQVNGNDVIQQPWHYQDQNSRNQGNQRSYAQLHVHGDILFSVGAQRGLFEPRLFQAGMRGSFGRRGLPLALPGAWGFTVVGNAGAVPPVVTALLAGMLTMGIFFRLC